jgi:hypothetical protein
VSRYNSTADILPYSDRKAARAYAEAWTIEDICRAQQMACDGKPFDEIARELGRTSAEIAQIVDPEPKADRQERAGMGYAHLKGR